MTHKNFIFRVFAYKDDDTYTAVCMDLDIVEENHQSLQQAVLSINEAIDSYMKSAAKLGFPKELTNRPAPKLYWKKLNEFTNPIPKVMSHFQYFTATPEGKHQLYA